MYHPITTEKNNEQYANNLVQAVLEDNGNYIVIKPNNDMGSKAVNQALSKLENNSRFTIFPSLRFEYFLVLLKYCNFIIGNSSAGVREAPYYGINSIDIGNRQLNRVKSNSIIHTSYKKGDIIAAIKKQKNTKVIYMMFPLERVKAINYLLIYLNQKACGQFHVKNNLKIEK